MPLNDFSDYFGQSIADSQYLSWLDVMRAGLKPSGERGDFLKQQAQKKKQEEEDRKRREQSQPK